jgi:hypothetical protein
MAEEDDLHGVDRNIRPSGGATATHDSEVRIGTSFILRRLTSEPRIAQRPGGCRAFGKWEKKETRPVI